MRVSRKSKSLVGVDIEAGSVAAAEVESNGFAAVRAYGIAPLQPGLFRDGEVVDVDALADALKDLFAHHKLSKVVRLGLANQRVAVRTLRLPVIEKPEELETAVRFQAQDHVPMPLDQAVLEYQVVRYSETEEGERRMDVAVVAARRDMVTRVLEAARKAGLRVAGIDLAAFGMIRALAGQQGFAPEQVADDSGNGGPDAADEAAGVAEEAMPTPEFVPARLYCNLADVTNLAVARGAGCEFTRISPFGIEGVAQRLAERRGLTLEHARQWLVHVGLEQPVEELEGDPDTVSASRDVLAEGAAKLADELRLSLEFYGAQEGAYAVEGVVACGPGTTIPGLVARLQRELGYAFEIGRPRALMRFDDASAARLTLPYGLALEEALA